MIQYVAQWESGILVQWRPLTWAEYRSFRSRLQSRPMGVVADIYQACLIQGPDIEEVPAGIADFIVKHVMETPFSGDVNSLKTGIADARKKINNYLGGAKALICHLLHYKVEEVEQWDAETFLERLAMCELITGKTFEPADPRAEQSNDGPVARPKKPLTEAQKLAFERRAGRA